MFLKPHHVEDTGTSEIQRDRPTKAKPDGSTSKTALQPSSIESETKVG
jgi:hypothetical protein